MVVKLQSTRKRRYRKIYLVYLHLSVLLKVNVSYSYLKFIAVDQYEEFSSYMMDIGPPTMVTLLDDGLVESCLDDPISLLDRGELTVIDVDEIDATIEDPGYILDETPQTLNQTEVYTSSYKKRSVALPVSFFDISRNISLLMKCRPISIKIVDCDIYPWYYKKFKHMITHDIVISDEEEDLSQSKQNYDCADWSSSNATCDKDTTSGPKGVHKINLSSDQRATDLKLSNENGNLANVNEVNKNITYSVDSEKVTLKNHGCLSLLNKNTSECSFDRQPHDLLTYKTIAQSIVRNVYHNEVSNKADNICIQNCNISGNSENDIDLKSKKMDSSKVGKKNGARDKVITSPISPCTAKTQKKAKQNNSNTNNVLLTNPFKDNNILEKCNDSNIACEKYMSTINKVIPHYHCRGPVSINNNSNIYLSNDFGNEIHSQKLITNDISSHWHQPSKKNDIVVDNSDSTLTQHSQRRLVLSPNSTREISYMGVNQTFYNNPPIASQVTKQQGFENVNHTPIFERSYHYPNFNYQNNIYSPSLYPNSIKEKNGNTLRHVRRPNSKQISEANHRIYSQPSNLDTDESYTQKSLYLLNEYVHYSRTQVPLQRASSNINISQSNPLLTQLLSYQSTLEQHTGLGPRTGMKRNPNPSMASNFWLPSRPSPSPSSYEDYLALRQYNRDENFQYQNTSMHFNRFSNYGDISRPLKTIQTQINPAELTKVSPQNIPTDVTRFMNPIQPRKGSIERNISTRNIIKNINPVSNGGYDASLRIDMNVKANNPNIINIPNEYDKTKDAKVSNKTDKRDIIVLSSSKSNFLYSNLHNVTLKKVPFLNKSELNPIDQPVDTTKGYSPPILPIPSFKKSLEMLSESQHSPVLYSKESSKFDGGTPENVCVTIKKGRISQEYSNINISRKRKLNEDEKIYININKKTCKNAK